MNEVGIHLYICLGVRLEGVRLGVRPRTWECGRTHKSVAAHTSFGVFDPIP